MDFAPEWDAARDAGFEAALLDFDALTREGNIARSLRFVPESETPIPAFYRGWMQKSADYARLYSALGERGYQLTKPEDYQFCHEMPGWLPLFKGLTPETRWLPEKQIFDESLTNLLREFNAGPLLVKDFVKSRKHEWHEACFIPDVSDESGALKVIHRFLELQGEGLTGGVVLRRFMPLDIIGEHPRSKMPLGREWRIFVCRGQIFPTPYWGQSDGDAPELTRFGQAMAEVSSAFWTMDVARTEVGEWIVLELGDGQVSGLPEGTDFAEFYGWLRGVMEGG